MKLAALFLILFATAAGSSLRQEMLGDFQPPAGFSLPSIKCNPDPARLSPDDVTLVIAVLRVDN